ncbi:MAG: hypothetical protein PUC88_03135 [Clostridia bacterium]|nr:hypothetical protein [Clostridia bacterium]
MFSIGIDAMSEINRVTTNSDVCRSPICRLPMSLIATIMVIYIKTVRKIKLII